MARRGTDRADDGRAASLGRPVAGARGIPGPHGRSPPKRGDGRQEHRRAVPIAAPARPRPAHPAAPGSPRRPSADFFPRAASCPPGSAGFPPAPAADSVPRSPRACPPAQHPPEARTAEHRCDTVENGIILLPVVWTSSGLKSFFNCLFWRRTEPYTGH